MRTCEHCGAGLAEGSSFCTNCGTAIPPQQSAQPQPDFQPQQPPVQPVQPMQTGPYPQQPYYPQPGMMYPPNPEGEKKATTCLVLGLLSFFLSCIPIFPIVLGIIGITKYKYAKNTNKKSMATVGLVFSILGLISGVFMILYYAVIIAAFVAAGGSSFWEEFARGGYPYGFSTY